MFTLPTALQNKLNRVVPQKEQLDFIVKNLELVLSELDVEVTKSSNSSDAYTVYSDGGARGNPGPAGCGAIIFDNNKKVCAKLSHFIPHATNNEAEYEALLLGVKNVLKLNPQEVVFYLDSELIVKQMKGVYRVKKAELKTIHDKIKLLLIKIPKFKFVHIPREKNQLADQLANQAMDRRS